MAAMSPSRLRVLMLAYFFPPYGGGGVQRTLKYVKYLPGEGFDPIVVTSRPRGYPIRDPTLSRDVPAGAVVLRAPTVPVHIARWKLQGLLRRMQLSPWAASFIGWPDEMAGWLPGCLVRALAAVRAHQPDVLYSTSSPATAHLAALLVH